LQLCLLVVLSAVSGFRCYWMLSSKGLEVFALTELFLMVTILSVPVMSIKIVDESATMQGTPKELTVCLVLMTFAHVPLIFQLLPLIFLGMDCSKVSKKTVNILCFPVESLYASVVIVFGHYTKGKKRILPCAFLVVSPGNCVFRAQTTSGQWRVTVRPHGGYLFNCGDPRRLQFFCNLNDGFISSKAHPLKTAQLFQRTL
jgi:hypothetical protein